MLSCCARQKGSDTFCGCHNCAVPLQTPPINPRFKWSGNDKICPLERSFDCPKIPHMLTSDCTVLRLLNLIYNWNWPFTQRFAWLGYKYCKSKGYPSLQVYLYYWLHANIMLLNRKLLCFRRLAAELRTGFCRAKLRGRSQLDQSRSSNDRGATSPGVGIDIIHLGREWCSA